MLLNLNTLDDSPSDKDSEKPQSAPSRRPLRHGNESNAPVQTIFPTNDIARTGQQRASFPYLGCIQEELAGHQGSKSAARIVAACFSCDAVSCCFDDSTRFSLNEAAEFCRNRLSIKKSRQDMSRKASMKLLLSTFLSMTAALRSRWSQRLTPFSIQTFSFLI